MLAETAVLSIFGGKPMRQVVSETTLDLSSQNCQYYRTIKGLDNGQIPCAITQWMLPWQPIL